MTSFRRPLITAAAALAFAGGLAGCGDDNRNSNPEVEDERLGEEERQQPPDGGAGEAAPTTDGQPSE